jgi:hypothetical protein
MSEIKITDLRIGNYIQELECEPYYFQVEEISKFVGYELWVKLRNGSIKTKNPEPILLTEEWLLKFGFNKDYKEGYIGIDTNNTDFVLSEPKVLGDFQNHYAFEFKSGGWSKFNEFEYVHELQNFFFALTKNELSVVS